MEHKESLEKLNELIKDIKVAMFTTVEADGSLRSRPMWTQDKPSDGTLWFFTGLHSAKSEEIGRERHVNLSYADAGDNRYVSISGMARVVKDREKAEEFWTPAYKAWFPGGLDDPNLALISVEIDRAEFWDAPQGKMVQAFGFAKALLTGKPYAGEGSDHETITF